MFHSASKVIAVENAGGTSIEADLMDWEDYELVPNYTVRVRLPKKNKKDGVSEPWCLDLPDGKWEPNDTDNREKTLSIDLDSIRVEHIESVKIKSTGYNVSRLAYEISSEEVEDV